MKLRLSKLFFILILVVEIVVLMYFGTMKKGMHFDECFSYFNTNNSVGREAYDRSFVSSSDIMKDFYVKDGERFNYSYVVKLQSFDVHPPLFYLLLHTLCSLFPNIFSMWFGLSLNILYALITSIFVFLIVKELTKSEYIALGIMLIAAVNPGVISNVMYIRMYCLMTLFIMITVYLHIKMSEQSELNTLKNKYIIFNAVLAFLGFMTHYFYLAFIFFLELGFWLPKIFKWKRNYKGFLKYFVAMLFAGILGVVLYPACLGHVNSGYRGQEVRSYMLDFSDLGERMSFFIGLINDYIFDNFLYIILIAVVLLLLTSYYKMKKQEVFNNRIFVFIECIFVPTLGYFLVSAKGALLGDVTMMRYQLPIYNLVIIGILLMLYGPLNYLIKNNNVKNMLFIFALVSFLIINVHGMLTSKVNYLYENQEKMNEIAKEHKDEVCVYIYNDEANKYLLWNDFSELSQYKEVYFVLASNKDAIIEEKINNASNMVVYVSSLNEYGDFDEYVKLIKDNNKNIKSYEKLYDAMYATAYEFY